MEKLSFDIVNCTSFTLVWSHGLISDLLCMWFSRLWDYRKCMSTFEKCKGYPQFINVSWGNVLFIIFPIWSFIYEWYTLKEISRITCVILEQKKMLSCLLSVDSCHGTNIVMSDCTIVTSGHLRSIRTTIISNNITTQKTCNRKYTWIPFCYWPLGILFEVLRIDCYSICNVFYNIIQWCIIHLMLIATPKYTHTYTHIHTHTHTHTQ